MRRIEEVTYLPIRPTEKGLLGFASCTFDSKLSLNCISVYSTPTGDIRLLFPEKVLANGKRLNVFYPITKETYEAIRVAVKDKVEELTKKARGEHEERNPDIP